MANDLTLHSDALPGLDLVDEGERVLAAFVADLHEEGGTPMLSVLPSKAQRAVLIEHCNKLGTLIRPTSMATEDGKRAASALALMFSGFLSLRKADAVELVTTFLAHLEELPVFAIEAACRDVPAGRVTEYDQRRGRHVPIDPAYPPTSPQLFAAAARHAEKHRAAHYNAGKVLAITKIYAPVSEAERERVQAKLKELATSLAERSADAMLRDSKRAQAGAKELPSSADLARREYDAKRQKPIYAGDIMISPSLAQQIADRDPGNSRLRKGRDDE